MHTNIQGTSLSLSPQLWAFPTKKVIKATSAVLSSSSLFDGIQLTVREVDVELHFVCCLVCSSRKERNLLCGKDLTYLSNPTHFPTTPTMLNVTEQLDNHSIHDCNNPSTSNAYHTILGIDTEKATDEMILNTLRDDDNDNHDDPSKHSIIMAHSHHQHSSSTTIMTFPCTPQTKQDVPTNPIWEPERMMAFQQRTPMDETSMEGYLFGNQRFQQHTPSATLFSPAAVVGQTGMMINLQMQLPKWESFQANISTINLSPNDDDVENENDEEYDEDGKPVSSKSSSSSNPINEQSNEYSSSEKTNPLKDFTLFKSKLMSLPFTP